jgi:hypothetical protein
VRIVLIVVHFIFFCDLINQRNKKLLGRKLSMIMRRARGGSVIIYLDPINLLMIRSHNPFLMRCRQSSFSKIVLSVVLITIVKENMVMMLANVALISNVSLSQTHYKDK